MRKHGYIEQFDPNKHLLQNSENPKENKDLQLFKELIQWITLFNLIKHKN